MIKLIAFLMIALTQISVCHGLYLTSNVVIKDSKGKIISYFTKTTKLTGNTLPDLTLKLVKKINENGSVSFELVEQEVEDGIEQQ